MTAKSPDALTEERLRQESLILDDIQRRTGLGFKHLASIDRNQVDIMAKILPIVKEWIYSGPKEIRGALYFEFLTLAALPHLEDILAWARTEQTPLDREVLTQVMKVLVNPKTAKRIWQVYQELDPTDSEPLLLTRLVRVASIANPVADRIVDFLKSTTDHIELKSTLPKSALQEYSRVRHPKVRAWFARYLESPDPDLRAMAKRSNGIRPKIPEGCQVVRGAPDRSHLILSTEIDYYRFADFLRELKRDLGAEFLPNFDPEGVTDNLSESKWVVCDVVSSKRGPLDLWLRLEDPSTIEAWVVGHPFARS